jgi:hypothetical protein
MELVKRLRRMNFEEHAERMGRSEIRTRVYLKNAKNILLRRTKRIWGDNIKTDHKEMACERSEMD